MSLRTALRGLSRAGVGALVAAAALAMLTGAADAKRIRIGGSHGGHSSSTHGPSSHGDGPHVAPSQSAPSHAPHAVKEEGSAPPGLAIRPRLRDQREEAKEQNATPAPAAAQQASTPQAPQKSAAAPEKADAAPARQVREGVAKDLVVDGCPDGHLCTVCVAGCVTSQEAIVHQQRVEKIYR